MGEVSHQVPRRPQYIASQVEQQKQLVDGVAESLETLRLNVLADGDSERVHKAAETLREAAQRSVQLETPSDPMENAFRGDSDIFVAHSVRQVPRGRGRILSGARRRGSGSSTGGDG